MYQPGLQRNPTPNWSRLAQAGRVQFDLDPRFVRSERSQIPSQVGLSRLAQHPSIGRFTLNA